MNFNGSRFDIQGINPLDLCEQYGTPLYVYDAQIIENQYKILRGAFADVSRLRINFAIKALTNVSVLKFMKRLGSCVDTVSIEEVKLCLRVGFEPQQIGYTPSGVSWSEIEEAVRLGVKVHLDSLPLLERFGKAHGANYPVGIRLNPHVMAGGNLKISTAHERSKFGISILQLDDIQRIMKETGVVIEGLHQHTGSEIKESEVFLNVAELIFDAAKNFPDLQYIDLGGGFKVPYKPHEKGTNMPKVGAAIAARFNQFCKDYGRDIELVWEPGKFLVAQCGTLLVRVNVVKHNPSISFAHVDSGLNHLIRPMMYDAYHEIVNVSNPLADKRLYNVVGYICETDNLAEDREMPEITEGDVLGIQNAGAYCFTMASNYNSRVRPAEVLVYNGQAHLVRARETWDDIVRNQIEVEV
ncbi:MAG: diaminopimelate decarboxylase [Saprospiraceae bacterium]|nr:diaminopimelate decarboxylase [Saprospiraceae bacterium]